jgi:hypothetical protein
LDAGMTTMTKAEYAKYRNRHPSLVSRWIRTKRIAVVGDKIDVEQSDRLLAATLDQARGGRNGRPANVSYAGPGPIVATPAQQGDLLESQSYSKVRGR